MGQITENQLGDVSAAGQALATPVVCIVFAKVHALAPAVVNGYRGSG